uniref:Uncharacterized protein n=1 Tax=Melanopsichium pennsylvanicum 4 TaxID=1398559 RepID=A0A077R2W1_9BASI|nr:uncharacterized protein BN887_06103 [Melanopsichium pennsylvanicum 4]
MLTRSSKSLHFCFPDAALFEQASFLDRRRAKGTAAEFPRFVRSSGIPLSGLILTELAAATHTTTATEATPVVVLSNAVFSLNRGIHGANPPILLAFQVVIRQLLSFANVDALLQRGSTQKLASLQCVFNLNGGYSNGLAHNPIHPSVEHSISQEKVTSSYRS